MLSFSSLFLLWAKPNPFKRTPSILSPLSKMVSQIFTGLVSLAYNPLLLGNDTPNERSFGVWTWDDFLFNRSFQSQQQVGVWVGGGSKGYRGEESGKASINCVRADGGPLKSWGRGRWWVVFDGIKMRTFMPYSSLNVDEPTLPQHKISHTIFLNTYYAIKATQLKWICNENG